MDGSLMVSAGTFDPIVGACIFDASSGLVEGYEHFFEFFALVSSPVAHLTPSRCRSP